MYWSPTLSITLDQTVDISALPPWAQKLYREAWVEAKRRANSSVLSVYQTDPVKFGNEVLGHRYYPDVEDIMRSIVLNPITVAKSATGVGKTFSAADIALWWFLVYEDSEVFATAAPPLENLKNLLWGEMMYTVRHNKDLFKLFTLNELIVKRHDKSAIHGVTIPMTGTSEERVGKFSGKHAPHLLFIVDEGDAVPPEIYEAIDGCMSGGMARLLIMFNPKAQQGPVYQMEIENRAYIVNLSALRHPNVTTGNDAIPGAVTKESVVRRINQWTRPAVEGEEPVASRKFEVPEFLIGAVANSLQGIPYPPLVGGTRVIMESAFSYKVLGQYPEQGENQLISPEWIKIARQRWDAYVKEFGERPPAIRPRLGLDVAEFGQDFNAPVLRYGDFVPKIERIWQGVDPTVSGERAAELCRIYNVDVILVDGTGYGSSIAPQISKLSKRKEYTGIKSVHCVSVKVAGKPMPQITSELGEFFQIRDQLWWACREWLREGDAMLPPEPMLMEELMTPTYRIDDRGKIHMMDKDTMREKLKRSPNYADALVLTFLPANRATVQRLGE
jgi:phage terminase large subunit